VFLKERGDAEITEAESDPLWPLYPLPFYDQPCPSRAVLWAAPLAAHSF
jgi:hypothetical protein